MEELMLMCRLLLVAACLLVPIVFLLSSAKSHRRLPPGPASVPLLGYPVWLTITDGMDFLRTLRRLHSRYGPVLAHRMGSVLHVTVADRRLAHALLVERGAALADRPEMASREQLGHNGAFSITNYNYGPFWRLLRRNFALEIASPARIRQFAMSRELVVTRLTGQLRREQQDRGTGAVSVRGAFLHAMSSLFVTMCFGQVLDEDSVHGITAALCDMMVYAMTEIDVFFFLPAITTRLFRGRLQALRAKRQKLKDIYLPLINARRERKKLRSAGGALPHCYVDSLFDIRLEEDGGRALTDDEIASLCSEFVGNGTDLPVTALEWTMAEIVKNPGIQEKLYDEIIKATADSSSEHGAGKVSEGDIHKMPYLKAVVLEGLRRHPPGHILVPRAATEDVELGAYVVPKGSMVNVMVPDVGTDEGTWDRPTEFMPERFLPGGDGEGLDITGSKEIKMIPFGAGRRVCPGIKIALLHLEYFVANLVAAFEWQQGEGEDVDVTSEEARVSIVMKKPLRARLVPRRSA
jgi:cytochrome P450